VQELALNWYAALGSLNSVVSTPLRELADGSGVPLVAVLLFGLIGATSPCQLTTNLGALAYLTRKAGSRRSVALGVSLYLLGKVLVYTVVGIAVIVGGRQLAQGSVPLIVVVRKMVGPLMLLLGLYLLGVVPLRFSLGDTLSSWFEKRAGRGTAGPFFLGIAFALAFCPTLFLLFFGLTIPLAVASPLGMVYPGIFAVGTLLPTVLVAGLLTAGIDVAKNHLNRSRQIAGWLQRVAALLLLLAGLSDTVTYWLM
jgi:cytochrome c-type biogenesis protein